MLLTLAIIVVVAFLAVSVYLYFNQKNMVFYPTGDIVVNPGDINLEYEDVHIEIGDDATLHGWFVPGDNDSTAVLFCHGNAGNISHRLETVEFLHDLGVSTLIFDYRGYGNSTGEPTEDGVYADADACYNWLTEQRGFKPQDIVIFGRSLGGAVAIDLASRVECRGLIVESSFTSVADMARKIFPILPTAMLVRFEFRSIDKIAGVNCPILVVHSPEDDLIPFEMGEKLFEKAKEPKQFVKIYGGHNDRDYLNLAEYRAAVSRIANKQ